jgi:hypothetical protein
VAGEGVAKEGLGSGGVAQDAEGLDRLGVGGRGFVGLDHPAQSVDGLVRAALGGVEDREAGVGLGIPGGVGDLAEERLLGFGIAAEPTAWGGCLHAELPANQRAEGVFDLCMPRDGCFLSSSRIDPEIVFLTVSLEVATCLR